MGRRNEGKRRFVLSLLPLERDVFERAKRQSGELGSLQSWALRVMMDRAWRDLTVERVAVEGGCRR